MKKIATTTAQSQGLDPIDGATVPENLFAPTANSVTADSTGVQAYLEENKGAKPGTNPVYAGEPMTHALIVQNNTQKMAVCQRDRSGNVTLALYDRNTNKYTEQQFTAGLFANLVALGSKIQKL